MVFRISVSNGCFPDSTTPMVVEVQLNESPHRMVAVSSYVHTADFMGSDVGLAQ